MKVAVIGAGFTGLAAAYKLVRAGVRVQVFEKSAAPGGLALGFKDRTWDWQLEAHYHHLFTSDKFIIDLASRLGITIDFFRPKTSTFVNSSIYQLDSPQSLLAFPGLSLPDRLRTGIGLAGLKLNPFWQLLEAFTAKDFITRVMGLESWKVLWEPLFVGKFGRFADRISAAWFWARVYKRSSSLGYPAGGFQTLANKLAAAIINSGGEISYNQDVHQITSGPQILTADGLSHKFSAVICTLPLTLFTKLTPDLPPVYVARNRNFTGLGAVNLVLALKRQLLTDNTYWLNINDRTHPYLAVVEHTNLINPKYYGGDHLVYVGNYLPADHPYFQSTAADLLAKFLPYLQQIAPQFSPSWVRRAWVHTAAFAQPIVTCSYSRLILPFSTPLAGVYLANMQQVYPWDRGTNYAVELGEKVADKII